MLCCNYTYNLFGCAILPNPLIIINNMLIIRNKIGFNMWKVDMF